MLATSASRSRPSSGSATPATTRRPAPCWISAGRSSTSICVRAGAERDRALDRVLELAHVAGPGIRHQPPHRLLRDGQRRGRARSVPLARTCRESAGRAAGCPPCARAAAAAAPGSRSGGRTDPRGTARPRPSCARSLLVAAITRTSTLIVCESPTRSNSRSCSTRSSFICSAVLIVPTSSRNSVPLCACSRRPCRLPTAPVNAPRTWPKSSASSSVSGIALQLSATNRCARRGLL